MKIRRFTENDLQDLYETISDPEVMRYIEPPYSMEQTREFLMQCGLSEHPRIYVAEADGEYIGYVINHDYDESSIEIGWLLKRSAWGKGYAKELTQMMIEMAKQERKSVVIECAPEQEVTKHIAESFGFEFQGIVDGCCLYMLRCRNF
ncbi:MAG: GNAT family N-acetyltransferase [Lachnospiraceae bacterium]|nr:GNAT family N-acetyltransferase [Lachnospiraceae bacterium]